MVRAPCRRHHHHRGVYGGECRWSARRADDIDIAGLKRWYIVVDTDGPRTAPATPSPRWWMAVDADVLHTAPTTSAPQA